MLYYVTDSADIGSKGITQLGNTNLSGLENSASEMSRQGKQIPKLHGNDLTAIFLFCFIFVFNYS